MFSTLKNTAAALMAGFALAAASPAIAQNNVIIYGRIAGGFDYISKVATDNTKDATMSRYGSNQWGTSLWGLRIKEELGNGLSAVVNLESAFSTGTGDTGNALWGRYSVIGLSSNSYGTLVMGRAMAIPDGEVYAIDPMGMQATSAATLHNNRAWGPRSRVITYNSPDLGDVSFRVQARLNKDQDAPLGRLLAGVVTYSSGPLMLKGLYEEVRDAQDEFNSLYTASRLYVVGGTYQIDDLKILYGYSMIQSGAGTVADPDNPVASTKQKTGWIGLNYRVNSHLSTIGGIYRASRNKGGGGATLAAIGVNYSLSPKTMLYAAAGTVANRANAAFTSELGGGRPLPGTNQRNIYAGVLQWF
ncbi:porin [Undibacterium sp. Di27W]